MLPESAWVLERVYTPPGKEMDYANFVGGAKPLIDGLIHYGIIVDDAPSHFHCKYEQTPGDENATYLILLEAIHGSDSS